MKAARFALFLALAIAAGTAAAQSVPTIYENARVWDGRAFVPRTLAVADGRFVDPARVAPGARRISLAGRYVVPAYGNAHAHITRATEQSSRDYVDAGVFYVWNVNTVTLGDEHRRFFGQPGRFRVKIAQGGITEPGGHPERLYVDMLGPRIYPGRPREWFVGNAFHYGASRAQIDAALAELSRQRADFIKIMLLNSERYAQIRDDPAFYGLKGLNPANVPYLVRRAHRLGLKVVAHVETAHDLRVAAEAGVDIAAHLPGYGPVSPAEEAARRITPAIARAVARSGMRVTPTASFVRFNDGQNGTVGPDGRRAIAVQAHNLRLLRAAGVRLLLGTDGPSAIFAEAEHLVDDNGLSAREVAAAAFATGAALFPERRIGCFTAGCEADFLVLSADPTSDIRALRTIEQRVMGGETLTPPASAASLAAPARIILGDPTGIAISGLRPGSIVRVHALRRTTVTTRQEGQLVQRPVAVHAWADYRADPQGQVRPDGAAPLAGTYDEADHNGLLWSGWPVGDARLGAGARADLTGETLADNATLLVRIEQDGVVGPEARIALASYGSELSFTELDVASDGVSGVFASPADAARLPAVIVLHGSEGGSMRAARVAAAQFAQRGIPALAINYVAYAWDGGGIAGVDTALANVPVELVDRARTWLARRPEVDGERIAIRGGSKGAELALVAAATFPWVRAVVACVPSDVVWSGFGREARPGEMLSSWSIGGRPLPFIGYDRYDDVFANRATAAEVHDRSRRLAGPATVAAARIPIERIDAPILLLGSGQDEVWSSAEMTRTIERALRGAGRSDRLEAVVYEGARHNICGTGAAPARADGTDGADTARAAGNAFARTLAFLRRALATTPAP